ncbi:trehalose-6-phosphate synthase [Bradyrhizobium viridifuturi]|uniref:trehalose-6-phosphate synthase n=1 Tax=Bradyrhizobium viridifuturi TaxID=1654716 RepID=UPI001FCCD1B4|nr:trehalose-6-phosphate synthase [Bradyrhizobium viridifuturi]
MQRSGAVWVGSSENRGDGTLLPLGARLHELGIDRPTGFFLHTPWSEPDMVERVPNHRELMKSTLKYDLLGFQTNRDLNNYPAYLRTHFGLETRDGVVTTERGQTRLKKFPIGIDPKQFADYLAADLSSAEQEKVRQAWKASRDPGLRSAWTGLITPRVSTSGSKGSISC